MPCSGANPGPRYVELVKNYKDLHENGDKLNEVAPENTFDGRSLMPHVNAMTEAAQRRGGRDIVDRAR